MSVSDIDVDDESDEDIVSLLLAVEDTDAVIELDCDDDVESLMENVELLVSEAE